MLLTKEAAFDGAREEALDLDSGGGGEGEGVGGERHFGGSIVLIVFLG